MKSKGDNFLQYMAGWHCGAGIKALDLKRYNHEDAEFAELYREGWRKGREASRDACKAASERFDYKPKIIKSME